MVDRQLKMLEGEVALQIQHLEQKLVKDYDSKIARQSKQQFNELQIKAEAVKEEVMGMVVGELSTNVKTDIMKQVIERLKESNKANERNQNELRELLNEKSQQIEELMEEQEAFQRDSGLKQKALKDQ